MPAAVDSNCGVAAGVAMVGVSRGVCTRGVSLGIMIIGVSWGICTWGVGLGGTGVSVAGTGVSVGLGGTSVAPMENGKSQPVKTKTVRVIEIKIE
jgi:hypothetical protein